MGHDHHHPHGPVEVAPRVTRYLLLALAPFLIATIVGFALLWPEQRDLNVDPGGFNTQEFKATVTEVVPSDCPEVPGRGGFVCSRVTVELEEGPDAGDSFTFDYSNSARTRSVQAGDGLIVGSIDAPAPEALPPGVDAPPKYFFLDFDRRVPLIVLALVFSVFVIALSRLRGLAALAGLAVSLLVLVRFVLPAILQGEDPLLVAIVGGAGIMFLALYLAHGFNAATTTAVLGTLVALTLTGGLALLFVNISIFTGAGTEEAAFLQISQQQVNLQGLLLASIIIGTLGVLDDVTVTQASAVWELKRANQDYQIRDLYGAGIRIGRDHIASTVNTLVLAYTGASLPLLILFSGSNRALGLVLNTETVAEEIVRTLVGSIGLVASVPITTGLAAVVVTAASRIGEDEV
ncbi:MAG TPA: YibE/F family protein [Actinomycetota bacterium]|nr:YibE/F family protein [Actinomycetota bacterium]